MQKHPFLALILSILPVFLIVGSISTLAVGLNRAYAEETPPKIVLRIEKIISDNQDTITETRDAHIQFMTAKDDNTYQVRRLREQCYEFDWSTGKATKIPDCTPSDLLE